MSLSVWLMRRYVCVKWKCMCVNVSTCVCMHVEAGDKLTYHFSGATHLAFVFVYCLSLTWKLQHIRLTGKRAPGNFLCSPSTAIPSAWITSAHHHTWLLFTWVLRMELGSSCVQSKCFIDWAVSSPGRRISFFCMKALHTLPWYDWSPPAPYFPLPAIGHSEAAAWADGFSAWFGASFLRMPLRVMSCPSPGESILLPGCLCD